MTCYAAPWPRQLVASLLPLRSEFDIGPDHVRFVVEKVALGEALSGYLVFPGTWSFRVLGLSPFSIIPSMSHIHLLLYMLLLPDGQTGEINERCATSVVHWGRESCFIMIFRPLRKRIYFLAFLRPFNGIIVDTKWSIRRKISCT
jgi:hypothetical protein